MFGQTFNTVGSMKLKSFKRTYLLGGLLSVGLLLGIPHPAKAQISEPDASEFRRIEQPLAIKVGVAAAGAGLVGLELWWFLLGKKKA